jgi:hypothetical protein
MKRYFKEALMIVANYMVMFRGMLCDKDLAPEEIQTVASQWTAWFDRLTQQGKIKSSRTFVNQGKIVSCKNGQVVIDDCFAETRETIFAYMLLEGNSLAEAVKVTKKCPSLSYGASAEIRPILER